MHSGESSVPIISSNDRCALVWPTSPFAVPFKASSSQVRAFTLRNSGSNMIAFGETRNAVSFVRALKSCTRASRLMPRTLAPRALVPHTLVPRTLAPDTLVPPSRAHALRTLASLAPAPCAFAPCAFAPCAFASCAFNASCVFATRAFAPRAHVPRASNCHHGYRLRHVHGYPFRGFVPAHSDCFSVSMR